MAGVAVGEEWWISRDRWPTSTRPVCYCCAYIHLKSGGCSKGDNLLRASKQNVIVHTAEALYDGMTMRQLQSCHLCRHTCPKRKFGTLFYAPNLRITDNIGSISNRVYKKRCYSRCMGNKAEEFGSSDRDGQDQWRGFCSTGGIGDLPNYGSFLSNAAPLLEMVSIQYLVIWSNQADDALLRLVNPLI